LAFDPYVDKVELILNLPMLGVNSRQKVAINTVSMQSVLTQSDFITFHIPFNEGDKAPIDATVMATMKKGVGLVNCSRGGVISEPDLLLALDSGQIGFAGLDVFEKEPPVNMAILQHNHVSVSPHVGGSTKEAQNRISIELAEKVIEFFKN
jgi:D-3-phosphoglycerate dehydrogenase